MNKKAYYIVLVIGILTCLSFFPHAFLGMQQVMEHIQKGEIQEPAANGMRMIWLYSSIMMLLSGLNLLILANHILIGSHKAQYIVFFMGVGLLAFGLSCTYISKEIDAMFGFTIQGVLLILATTVFFKRAHHHIHNHDETQNN